MNKMEFMGDISLEEIYEQNKDTIYSSFIKEIRKVASDSTVDQIEVMEFKKNGVKFTIDLKRAQFIDALKDAIKYYVSPEVENYEKCNECKELINLL